MDEPGRFWRPAENSNAVRASAHPLVIGHWQLVIFNMTLYYHNIAGAADWSTAANWWEDDAITIAHNAQPGGGDDCVIDPSVTVTIDLTSWNGVDSITGNVAFTNPARVANSVPVLIAGNPVFHDDVAYSGTLIGDAQFFDTSSHAGSISGNASFHDSSQCLAGSVLGDASFGDNSSLQGGTVSGAAAFHGHSSELGGDVSGQRTFNDSSSLAHEITGAIENGDPLFLDDSYAQGTSIIHGGSPTFRSSSKNQGVVIGGTAVFRDASVNDTGAEVSDAEFYDSSRNSGRAHGYITARGVKVGATWEMAHDGPNDATGTCRNVKLTGVSAGGGSVIFG